MSEQLEATGKIPLAVEQRLRAQLDRMKARSFEQGFKEGFKEGFEEGLARRFELGRELVRLLTATRFGADTAANLEPLLVGINDPKSLSSVSDWIMECATGQELLAQLRNAD